MMSKKYKIPCPSCKKEILFRENLKDTIKCGKCSHFIILIRGESNLDVHNHLKKEHLLFLKKKYSTSLDNIYLFIGDFEYDQTNLNTFMKKSKKAGKALEKYLKTGIKNGLNTSEKDILYKLKKESIIEIENKIKYLKAKIECIKLLKILDF